MVEGLHLQHISLGSPISFGFWTAGGTFISPVASLAQPQSTPFFGNDTVASAPWMIPPFELIGGKG
jgi:hypothetical protein